MGTPLHRRTFLKLSAAGAALGAAAYLKPLGGLAVASTLPLPFPHRHFPDAEALLTRRLDAFDLLLVPAYAAVELIRRNALRLIPGPPGRAHDPDGAYTLPYRTAVSALLYRGQPPRSLDDLWRADALWPDSSRLVIGAALLRRGYSPNDTHSGRLAQIEQDLLDLRPRLAPDPAAWLRSSLGRFALAPVPAALKSVFKRSPAASPRRGTSAGTRTLSEFEDTFLDLLPVGAVSEGSGDWGVMVPPEGVILIEYDWVIPLGADNPEAALAFIAHQQSAMPGSQSAIRIPHSTIPFTPLPPAALAQRAQIWARLKRLAS